MSFENAPKPTLYGCYLKNGRTKEKTFICNELSNSSHEAVGITHISIDGRLPQNNFLRNVQASYVCIVVKGSGMLTYFCEGVPDSYPIHIGDYIHLPQNSVYAFEGNGLEIILVGTPQWEWNMCGVIEPVTIN